MIEARRQQLSFCDGLIAETVTELYEPRMKHADHLLNDGKLV